MSARSSRVVRTQGRRWTHRYHEVTMLMRMGDTQHSKAPSKKRMTKKKGTLAEAAWRMRALREKSSAPERNEEGGGNERRPKHDVAPQVLCEREPLSESRGWDLENHESLRSHTKVAPRSLSHGVQLTR